MPHLAISLLGAFRVTLDDVPLTTFATDKVRALLAFLAVEANRPHRRETLIDLLWPERPLDAARNNLRQVLFQLRQTLTGSQGPVTHLLVTAKEVQFDPASDHWLDVAQFESCLATSRAHHPAGQILCPACLARLETAAGLYWGDFLAGFSLPDCPRFEWWQLLTQEACHRQALEVLSLLVNSYEAEQDYDRVSRYACRQIELEPWRESAYRRYMRALALSGQRGEALRQYEICREQLAREMEVEPSAETTWLYQQILAGTLPGLRQPPAGPPLPSPDPSGGRIAASGPFDHFVGREAELAMLNRHLAEALSGRGRVLFIAGEVGSGKTLLLREFARQALEAQPRLLVAGDHCDARLGSGQPYQPFVGLLAALSGSGDLHRPTTDEVIEHQAHRLHDAFPSLVRAVVESGPDLVDTLIPAQLLARRLAALDPAGQPFQIELQTLLQAKAAGHDPNLAANPDRPAIEQAALFEQVTQMLLALAGRRPLVLILDDLQWADQGSIHLLFHLGRRLADIPLLIVGAYRPEQVALGHNGGRHALPPVLHELQALYGEIVLDLSRADGRQFLAAVLDSQPNRLDAGFRETLYQHTEGHALFTTELLRGMAARGELVQDGSGCWVRGSELNWDQLPARVEAVIAERVARLPEKCRELLAAASVQGETFILEVVARALDWRPAQALELFSRMQPDRHDLVLALCVELLAVPQSGYTRSQTLSRYRFRHFLFQQYIYQSLDPVSRNWLHRVTGEGLEALADLQAGQPGLREASPPRLAWHFEQAGQTARAAGYLLQAGKEAFRLSANAEAMAYLQQGLVLLEDIPDTPQRARQELSLQLTLGAALQASQGYAHPAAGRALRRAQMLCDQVGDAGQSFRVLWLLGLYYRWQGNVQAAHQLDARLLELAARAEDPPQVMLANWAVAWDLLRMGELVAARAHLEQAIALYDPQQHRTLAFRFGLDPGLIALAHLATNLWLLGYPEQALAEHEAALGLAQELDHPFSQGYVQVVLAQLQLFLRDFEAVHTRAEMLLRLATEYSLSHLLAVGVIFRGAALAQRGQVEKGLIDMERTIKELEASRTVALETVLGELATAYGLAGQPAAGLSLLAQSTGGCIGIRCCDAEIHRCRGELLEMQGAVPDEVAAHYWQAIQVARRQKARSWELRATVSLCRLWQSQGEKEAARPLLAQIYNWFSEGFETLDLKEAKALLDELG
jgi:predicted ATPase/DNA-binding SARP family transcriptional activator